MIRDALVEEVRAFRDEIAKEHNYDIDAIFVALRRMEAGSQGKHVSLTPRKVPKPQADQVPGSLP
jgi:hypothetical protein